MHGLVPSKFPVTGLRLVIHALTLSHKDTGLFPEQELPSLSAFRYDYTTKDATKEPIPQGYGVGFLLRSPTDER